MKNKYAKRCYLIIFNYSSEINNRNTGVENLKLLFKKYLRSVVIKSKTQEDEG